MLLFSRVSMCVWVDVTFAGVIRSLNTHSDCHLFEEVEPGDVKVLTVQAQACPRGVRKFCAAVFLLVLLLVLLTVVTDALIIEGRHAGV